MSSGNLGGNIGLGSVDVGSTGPGSAALGSAALGSVDVGSGKLGSARLGSGRLGSTGLGSAGIGSASPKEKRGKKTAAVLDGRRGGWLGVRFGAHRFWRSLNVQLRLQPVRVLGLGVCVKGLWV